MWAPCSMCQASDLCTKPIWLKAPLVYFLFYDHINSIFSSDGLFLAEICLNLYIVYSFVLSVEGYCRFIFCCWLCHNTHLPIPAQHQGNVLDYFSPLTDSHTFLHTNVIYWFTTVLQNFPYPWLSQFRSSCMTCLNFAVLRLQFFSTFSYYVSLIPGHGTGWEIGWTMRIYLQILKFCDK